jgi:hypothetical protein
MEAPTFVAYSDVPVSSAAGSDVVWPVGHQPDDIGLLLVETANETVATPAGWTLLDSIGTGTAGAAGSVALWAFWKRATTAAEANAVVADAGDHIRARILAFRGCETSGSPFSGSVVKAVEPTAQTAVTIGMPTTADADCYVLGLVANATDATSNQTTSGAWANATLADFARIIQGNTNVGVGGGYDGGGGTKAVAGAVGNSTTTLNTASAQAKLAFAFKPATGGGAVTFGGIYIVTGGKAVAGAFNATTGTLDAAAVQARVTIALKPPLAAPANTPPVLEAIPALTGAVLNVVGFPITVTDAEGDGVTLSLVNGATDVPVGAALVEDESSGNFFFEWTPTPNQAGEWNFILRATDDNVSPLSSDQAVSIVVLAGPDTGPPRGVLSGAITSIN